ncbi:MAG: patatin-like phospholipase family protein [Proteobacteria bacterium]|nr:patatin-like phospholipase family protein [Pseudomonadota bacterium]MBU1715406.1 patatin-like phospholipase family protein [Pseudomonadota bacterium]
MKSQSFILLLLVALMSCGCASYPVNPPLNEVDTTTGYRFKNLAMNPGNGDDTFIILALSGGGTRAAAFSYGAIQELNTIKIPGSGASLLDEVDIISSVSGGSFASAYYGLYGKERFLADFPRDVLSRKIQNAIILRILAPWNWWHLGSWYYGRSDLADSYYGKKIFNNATFKELPRQRPFIMMNSTDIGIGARFSFIQDHFDRLCSDMDQVSISRGVTASSAFPVAFTPLTFKNYPKEKCGYKTPIWLSNAREYDLEVNASRYDRALDWASYEDSGRSYMHLSDGGLSDNLGLRGPVLGLIWNASPLSIHKKFNDGKIKRVVIIAVDAQPKQPSKLDRSSHPPGIFNVLNAASSTPMENYSSDSIEQVRSYIETWNSQFDDNDEKSPIKFYFSRVAFEAEKDPELRRDLQEIKTKLQLPKKAVKLLIDAGGRLLRQSPDFQNLRRDLGIMQ